MQIELIKTNLKAQTEGKSLLPICLYGQAGVGKSSLLIAAAEQIGATYNLLACSSLTIDELSGLPTFIENDQYDNYSVSGSKNVQGTKWTIPAVLVETNMLAEKHGSCVLILDDFHELPQGAERYFYQLLLERRLGDYKLHDNVAIILSMNHTKATNFSGFSSAAVKSRLNLIPYLFNFDVWYDGFGRFLHPLISSFLKTNQQYINETESKTLEPSASARSWSKLSDEFELYTDEQLNKVYLTLVTGIASNNAREAFDKHVIYYNKLDFTSIVANEVIPTLSDLSELDKVLYGNVIHSIETPKHALYLINLLNEVRTQEHSDTFVGFLAAELYTQFSKKQNGITITDGQSIIIDIIISAFDLTKYKLSKQQVTDFEEITLDNKPSLLAKISEYINR